MKPLVKYPLIAVVALAIVAVGGLAYLGQKSQGGAAAGLVDGHLSPCPSSPNCVSSEAATPDDKKVEPLPVDVWARLVGVVADMGGTITQQGDRYVAAEFSSSTFKFVDDLEFRLTDDAVQMRSASRVGYSDRGVNSARVALLRERLGS